MGESIKLRRIEFSKRDFRNDIISYPISEKDIPPMRGLSSEAANAVHKTGEELQAIIKNVIAEQNR